MTKPEAVKEARIAVLYHGGTVYVTRKGKSYKAVHYESFEPRRHGSIVETLDALSVRSSIPA